MNLVRLSSIALITTSACVAEDLTTSVDEGAIQGPTGELHGFQIPSVGRVIPQAGPLLEELYRFEARSWLRWAMRLPYSTGPITDTTGTACSHGQSGPVWYLAGTAGGDATRACTIPADRFLYVPLINYWIIPPAADVDTPAELQDYVDFATSYFADLGLHTCNLRLDLDGAPLLPNQQQLQQKLDVQVVDPFAVWLDSDNFGSAFGTAGGLHPKAFTAGHYALVRPLPAGDHVLAYGASLCDDDGVPYFENGVTLDVTVRH